MKLIRESIKVFASNNGCVFSKEIIRHTRGTIPSQPHDFARSLADSLRNNADDIADAYVAYTENFGTARTFRVQFSLSYEPVSNDSLSS